MHRRENWHWQSKAFCAFSKVFALNSIMIWVSIAEICNPTSLNVAIQKVFCDKVLSVMICALRTFSSREPTHPLVKRYTSEAQIRWLMVWRASYFCVATKWSSLRFKQRYAGLTEVKRSTARTGNLWSACLFWKDTTAHSKTSFIFFHNEVFTSLICIILLRTVNLHHVQKKSKNKIFFIFIIYSKAFWLFFFSFGLLKLITWTILWNFK